MGTSYLIDLLTGLEVYYKMLNNINLRYNMVDTAYQLCWKESDGSRILFEIHERNNGYYVYNFISYNDDKLLFNINELKIYLIKYIDLKIRDTFVYS